MNVTEVRITLCPDHAYTNENIQAFASITLDDCFVIRDLKVIQAAKGLFVAFPSRKLMDRCENCGTKNHLRAKFCNDCGVRLKDNRREADETGRIKLHADLAHPINAATRDLIEKVVRAAYNAEVIDKTLPTREEVVA